LHSFISLFTLVFLKPKPRDSFKFQPVIAIYDKGLDETEPLNFTVEASFFADKIWDWFDIDLKNGRQLAFTINIPQNSTIGLYVGFMKVYDASQPVLIPISISIVETLEKGYLKNVWSPSKTDFTSDDGLNDWNPPDLSGTRLSGHWEVLTYNLTDINATALACQVEWQFSNTTIDLFIIDPDGRVVATSDIKYLFDGRYNSTATSFNQNFIISIINQTGLYRIVLHVVRLYGDIKEDLVVRSCYLTALPSALPAISDDDGSLVDNFLVGPHTGLNVTWDAINFSELPSLEFLETTLSLLSGFELKFTDTISKDEAIPSYSIDYWLEVNLSAGQVVELTGYFDALDFD